MSARQEHHRPCLIPYPQPFYDASTLPSWKPKAWGGYMAHLNRVVWTYTQDVGFQLSYS